LNKALVKQNPVHECECDCTLEYRGCFQRYALYKSTFYLLTYLLTSIVSDLLMSQVCLLLVNLLRLRSKYLEPDSSSHQEPSFCPGFSQSSKDSDFQTLKANKSLELCENPGQNYSHSHSHSHHEPYGYSHSHGIPTPLFQRSSRHCNALSVSLL